MHEQASSAPRRLTIEWTAQLGCASWSRRVLHRRRSKILRDHESASHDRGGCLVQGSCIPHPKSVTRPVLGSVGWSSSGPSRC